jgi:hypothetical protein
VFNDEPKQAEEVWSGHINAAPKQATQGQMGSEQVLRRCGNQHCLLAPVGNTMLRQESLSPTSCCDLGN